MSLIVEDGSIVANANSFVTLADARVRAEIIGVALPVDDTATEDALKTGALKIKQQEKSLQGTRVSSQQSLSYPRNDVVLYGFSVENDFIPFELIDAQVAFAAESATGVNILAPIKSNPSIKKQKMDELGEIEYFNGGSVTQQSENIRLANSLLEPLTLSAINIGSGFRCIRG